MVVRSFVPLLRSLRWLFMLLIVTSLPLQPVGTAAQGVAEPTLLQPLEPEVQLASGGDVWRSILTIQPVQAGDRIQTGPGAAARLLFADGIRTEVGPGTNLALNSLERGDQRGLLVRLVQLSGTTVKWNAAEDRPALAMEIETPAAIASTWEAGLRVDVTMDGVTRVVNLSESSGVVTVQSLAPSTTVTLRPGEMTDVQVGAPPGPVSRLMQIAAPLPLLAGPPPPSSRPPQMPLVPLVPQGPGGGQSVLSQPMPQPPAARVPPAYPGPASPTPLTSYAATVSVPPAASTEVRQSNAPSTRSQPSSAGSPGAIGNPSTLGSPSMAAATTAIASATPTAQITGGPLQIGPVNRDPLRQGASPTAVPVPSAQQGSSIELPGHVLPVLARATAMAAAPQVPGRPLDLASQPLTLTITLNRSDQTGFDAYLRGVEDPSSPNFRHFLSQDELARRFGPSQQDYDRVLVYVQQNGFSLVEGSTNRLTLTVQGTRGAAEQAFSAPIRDFELNGRTFRANTVNPAMPSSLAPLIQAITGLDNLAVPEPRMARARADLAIPSAAPSPRTPMSLATAYNFAGVQLTSGAPADGSGQTIGLVQYDAFFPSDVRNWLTSYGRCAPTDTACVNSFMGRLTAIQLTGPQTPDPNGGETEVLLDLATVMGMAPGALYRVYESCNVCSNSFSFAAMFQRMLNDQVTVISNSWGTCEAFNTPATVNSIETVLQSASAAGVSVFTASGDSGSTCGGNANDAGVPADAPHGIAVGGTSLQVGAGNAYQGETWWSNSIGAGGFGVSKFFSTPSYQTGLAANGRSVPDVSADADPNSGIGLYQADLGGLICCIGGTSMAAPAWAAGAALINQALGHLTGNWNAVLYAQRTTNAFHSPASMGSDFAHVGIGSFDLGNLLKQLNAAPPTCTVQPRVRVSATPANGVLQVIVTAQGANNYLTSLTFGDTTDALHGALVNAIVNIANQTISTAGSPAVQLTGRPTQTTFTVQRANPGQPVTVPLTVQDGCGPWKTLVGGGTSAGF